MTKTTEGEITVDLIEAQAVVPAKPNGVAMPALSANSMLEVIERASRDPSVDVDKLERLLALSERQNEKQAKLAYLDAMAKMKPELPIIDKKGHIVIHEKGMPKKPEHVIQDTAFARWEDIDEAITPVLTEYGFVITFRAGMAADGKVTVTGILSHTAGHSEETTIPLPHDSSGSKNPVQAVGSSLSYGKRYAATFLLNIRTKGEDDDGVEAGADDATLAPIQIEQITEMLARFGMNIQKFCDYLNVTAIAEIKRKDFEKTVKTINEVSLKRKNAQSKVVDQ